MLGYILGLQNIIFPLYETGYMLKKAETKITTKKKNNTDPRPHSQTIGLTLRMLGGWVCLIINKSDNMSLHKNTGHQKMNIGQRPYTALTTH